MSLRTRRSVRMLCFAAPASGLATRRHCAAVLAVAVAAACLAAVSGQPASAHELTPTVGAPADALAGTTVEPACRDSVLPKDWRTLPDVAWTTIGDMTGLHVLAAASATGYTWHTVATLAEPGFEVDAWVGNACLTGFEGSGSSSRTRRGRSPTRPSCSTVARSPRSST